MWNVRLKFLFEVSSNALHYQTYQKTFSVYFLVFYVMFTTTLVCLRNSFGLQTALYSFKLI